MEFTREQALDLWKKYNSSESLMHHALSVEAVMRHIAQVSGEDPEYWGLVGLLHDIDYGTYPEEHCRKAPELLREIGADDAFIHAVVSHGWGLCSDVEPQLYMEKALYTIDELTGLVAATALMRPEKMNGISVKSVKKKWSSSSFAAGVNRDVIANGAQMMGVDLAQVIQYTIDGMLPVAAQIGLQ